MPLKENSQLDLLHHLSDEARERLDNPMKFIMKIAAEKQGILSLANGNPHHSLYPISQIDFTVPRIDCDSPLEAWKTLSDGASPPSQKFTSFKDQDCTVDLRTALQYSEGAGLPEVRRALENLNQVIHSPPHNVVTLSLGNADSVTKCFRLFGNPGDSFLAEEYSFPGMTNAPLASGIKWVPVRMDSEGIIPEKLEEILANWNEAEQGRRPHVLYTIPSGQNPTGGTLSAARRRVIYKIACDYDLIILEDDPYYFLQYDRDCLANVPLNEFAKAFVRTLPPSFLSMDTYGRVLRLDSFSKLIAPGLRLGWITSNAEFARKLEILTDSSTQHPHGFGQCFVAEMLSERGWGVNGYLKWINELSDDYKNRRDLFMSTFRDVIGDCNLASANVPPSGMFVWIKINLEKHPRYNTAVTVPQPVRHNTNTSSLNEELFQKLFDAGFVLIPASYFAIAKAVGASTSFDLDAIEDRCNYFRATFASSEDVIEEGLNIFGTVIRDFFRE